MKDSIAARLDRIEQQLELLADLYLCPDARAEELRREGLRPKVVTLEEAARRARIGRSARARGWSYQQWVHAFGYKEPRQLSQAEQERAAQGFCGEP